MFIDGLRADFLKKRQDKERKEESKKKENLGVAEATGGLISDEEWQLFQNKNQVSDRIIEGIGSRVAEGKHISSYEMAIYDHNPDAVEEAGRRKEKELLEAKKNQVQNFQLDPAHTEDVPEEKKEKAEEVSQEAEKKLSGAKGNSIAQLDEVGSRLENGKIVFRAGVVDTGDIAASRARRTAHEQMTADKEELKGFGGFFKKIWKYNYAEQAIHEKKRVQAKDRIIEEGNIYANEDLSSEERVAAGRKFNEVTVSRFIAEAEDLIETGLGEKRQEIGEASPAEQKIKADLKKIIDDYADGKLDEAGFEGAKREIFAAIEKADSQETLRKGEMYVDNFLVIAQRVRELKNQMVQVAGHQAGLDRIDYDIELIVGRAKEGIKTEANYNIAEKTVERLRSTKLGSLVNETTLAVGVGAVYAAIEGVGKIVGSRTAAVITFGLSAGVSGVFAAVKEGQMQKRERETLESREAVGTGKVRERLQTVREEIADLESSLGTADKKEAKRINKELKAKRAEEKKLAAQEGYLYERRLANDLRADLEQAIKSGDADRLVACLAEAEARMKISDERKIDLVGYSDTVAVEEERLALLQAKAAARQQIAILQAKDARDLDNLLKAAVSAQADQLLQMEGGVLDRDKLFRKYRNSAVAKKLVQHVGVGLAVGLVAQEALAFATDKQEGLVENLVKGNDRTLGGHDTALEALRNVIGGHTAEQLQSVGVLNGTIKLPASCEWLSDGHGSYSILRGSDVIADGLHFNPDGSLTEEAKAILAEQGLSVSDSQHLIDQGTSTATVTRGPQEYIDKHPESFSKVSRQLWYDNDTPMYKGEDGKWHGADFNERRLDWGGDSGSGINVKTGSYEMSVFRMTADGSFHTSGGAKMSDDAVQLIKEGKMKVLFSLSAGTQNEVVELPVDPTTGKVSVPRDSDLGKLLFGENNGRAVLKARFAEAAFVSGEAEGGVQKVRLFATAVGEGLKETTDTVTTVNPPLVTTATEIGVPRTWIMPPFIPVGSRTPLEKLSGPEPVYNIYSARPADKEKKKEMDRRRSQSLENDPNAVLDQYAEIGGYLERLDDDYRKEVESLAAQAGEMGANNRLSICIPVAGHQEGTKIYESLKNYTYQTADPNSFEICLLVNHPDKDLSGKKIEPDQTLAEIERFRRDYPNFNVKVMYQILPRDKAKIGLVRKLLSDSVLLRQHARGEKAEDLIMVSNDADNLGIDPRYVDNFISRFDDNKQLDGVLGQLDWDPEAYAKYPLVHVGTRMFQYYSAYGRTKRGGIVSSGANYAYRASIYAGIGGYLDSEPGGEDVALGQAIALARGDSRTGERGYNFETQSHGGSASRLFTSARRAIDVLNKYGLAPVEQWDKGFSAFDDEIRKMELNSSAGEKINYQDKEWLEKFKKNLEHIINRTLDVYERGEKLGKGNPFYHREILGRLGIDYELDAKGDVVITDMSRLVAGLERYQEEGVLQRDARSGKDEAKIKLETIRKSKQAAADKAELASEAAEKEVIRENKKNLADFYSTDKLSFQVSETDTIIPAETEDEPVSELDKDYVRRDSVVFSDTDNGKVTVGFDKNTKKPVVIKENSSSGPDKQAPEQFLRTKRFKDPALLLPIKNFVRGGKNYRIYEAAKTDIDRYLDRQPEGRLKPKEALSVIIRMADVTGKLHKLGMVHGDIHPGNMYIFEDGVKLGDVDEAYIGNFEKSGIGGNRFIMAPEMFADGKTNMFDKSVDIYAMCASLYKMVVGRWPYQIQDSGMSIEEKQKQYRNMHREGKIEYPDGFPTYLKEIISKGMDPNPEKRYRSTSFFLNDLLKAYKSI